MHGSLRRPTNLIVPSGWAFGMQGAMLRPQPSCPTSNAVPLSLFASTAFTLETSHPAAEGHVTTHVSARRARTQDLFCLPELYRLPGDCRGIKAVSGAQVTRLSAPRLDKAKLNSALPAEPASTP